MPFSIKTILKEIEQDYQVLKAAATDGWFSYSSLSSEEVMQRILQINQKVFTNLNECSNQLDKVSQSEQRDLLDQLHSLKNIVDQNTSEVIKILSKNPANSAKIENIQTNVAVVDEKIHTISQRLLQPSEAAAAEEESSDWELLCSVTAETFPMEKISGLQEHVIEAFRLRAQSNVVQAIIFLGEIKEEYLSDPRLAQIIRRIQVEHPLLEEGEPLFKKGVLRIIHQRLQDVLLEVDPCNNLSVTHQNQLIELIRNLTAPDIILNRDLCQDLYMQTSIALACRYLANHYRKAEDHRNADYYMQMPSILPLITTHALGDLFRLRNLTPSPAVIWEQTGSTTVNNNQMRISQRQFDDAQLPLLHLTCTLPHTVREEMQLHFDQLKESEDLRIERDLPVSYYKYDNSTASYDQSAFLHLGLGIKLSSPGHRISFTIGNARDLWNVYHKIMIDITEDVTAEELYKFLSHAGLATLMLNSRPQDAMMIKLSKLAKASDPGYAAIITTSPEKWAQLAISTSPLLSNRAATMYLKDIGSGRLEYVDPTAVEAFHAKQGAGFAATLGFAGRNSLKEALAEQRLYKMQPAKESAMTLVYVLKGGLLSTLERYEQGILAAGCCPLSNIKTGSANQVFVRQLNVGQFQNNFSWSRYAIEGSILLLIKSDAVERLPYSYASDKGGLDNPEFYKMGLHMPQKEYVHLGLQGHMMRERLPPEVLAAQQEKSRSTLVTAETMYEDLLGIQYIAGAVVATVEDKEAVINVLQEQGIFFINNKHLAEVIFSSDRLTPEMLPLIRRDLE